MALQKITLIDLSIWTEQLTDINPDQITHDILTYATRINQNTHQHGAKSRGFVQHEDLILPHTPEITKLENTIQQRLHQLTGKTYTLTETWAVNLQHNQSVIAHTHHQNHHQDPNEYYSVTYYPQVPDGSAELIFTTDHCHTIESTHSITPQKGTMVIFNSYINHMTSRHNPQKPRLVISQNWAPTHPNTTPNADWSDYWNRPTITPPTPEQTEKLKQKIAQLRKTGWRYG